MKITDTDFAALRDAVLPVMRESTPSPEHSPERQRWDALHASAFDTRTLYRYMHDDHIDTALRKIQREVTP